MPKTGIARTKTTDCLEALKEERHIADIASEYGVIIAPYTVGRRTPRGC